MFSSFFPVLLQLFPVSSAGGSSCVEDQAELLGITTTRGQCLSNNRLETQFVFTLQITLNAPKNEFPWSHCHCQVTSDLCTIESIKQMLNTTDLSLSNFPSVRNSSWHSQ